MKKLMERHGLAKAATIDGPLAYRAAMEDIENAGKQGAGASPTTGQKTLNCRSDDESGPC